MEISNLNLFDRGWFYGNFSPTIFKTDESEVAIKKYKAGDKEARHYHKIATELTVILNGKVKMNGMVYGPDTIIKIEPNESTDFEALTDVITVVVKTPCVKNDKYLCY